MLCLLYCSLNFMYFLRARHDRNKTAPCGMIKVFELNWTELHSRPTVTVNQCKVSISDQHWTERTDSCDVLNFPHTWLWINYGAVKRLLVWLITESIVWRGQEQEKYNTRQQTHKTRTTTPVWAEPCNFPVRTTWCAHAHIHTRTRVHIYTHALLLDPNT